MPSSTTVTNVELPASHVSRQQTASRLDRQTLNDADRSESARAHLPIQLTTAVMSTIDFEPVVWVKKSPSPLNCDLLPSGTFDGEFEMALDAAVRATVAENTGLIPNYFNQLATFLTQSDIDAAVTPHLSIGYMALINSASKKHRSTASPVDRSSWTSCYRYLPWEDWRMGRPDIIDTTILPRLSAWAASGSDQDEVKDRQDQIRICFGSAHSWDDERVLERYLVMQSAILFANDNETLGRHMQDDHRKILAAALGRLRTKLRYRPVVFEVMEPEFTLFELQRTVEGIIGPHLHKQNFRRLVESMGLVEATGEIKNHTGGRPAKMFRFRPGVVLEQQAPGMRVRIGHT
jgi:hypothetical protein